MPASVPLFGAALGVGIQLYVNGVRKLPLMRQPWLHVLWAGAGYSFGTWLVGFEERTEKELAGGLVPAISSSERCGGVQLGSGKGRPAAAATCGARITPLAAAELCVAALCLSATSLHTSDSVCSRPTARPVGCRDAEEA